MTSPATVAVEPALVPPACEDRTALAMAGVLSAGAGVVHLGLSGAHSAHHWTMGAAFLATGWAQLAWPVWVWLRPRGGAMLAGAAVHLAALAGLLMVTVASWPFGPLAGRAEDPSTSALLCAALELGVLLALLFVALGRMRLPAAALPVTLALVLAASSTAVLADGHEATGDVHETVTAAGTAHAAPAVPAAAAAP